MTERTSLSTKCPFFDRGKAVITTKAQDCLKKNLGAATLTVFKAHFGQQCTWQVTLLEVVIALGVRIGASLAHGPANGPAVCGKEARGVRYFSSYCV